MTFDKRRNFKTPGGLKIRLNHQYFFWQLVKPERYYTDDEIVNNDAMYDATSSIETMYLIPKMLIQFFSIFAVIFHIDAVTFCCVSSLLYIFGCIWRCSKQDFLISVTLHFLATLYKILWLLCGIVLIILTFVLNRTYLIVPYIVIRIILFVYEMLQNHIVLFLTKKKYGVPFNDTEICAFVVFHLLSHSTERLSDYISSYVVAVHSEDKTLHELN